MAGEEIRQLTGFEMGLLFIVILFVLGIVALGFFWLSRKYPKHQQKLDPIYKGTFLVMAIYLVFMITPAVFGFIEPETVKKNSFWFIIAAVLLIAWYGFVVPYLLRKPIPTIKLWGRYVLPEVRHLFGGENYQGDAYRPPFIASEVMPSMNSPYLKNIGSQSSLMEVFLTQHVYGNRATGNTFAVLSIRDKFTGEGLKRHLNPPLNVVTELLGREVARSYEHPIEEYDTQQPEQKVVTQ